MIFRIKSPKRLIFFVIIFLIFFGVSIYFFNTKDIGIFNDQSNIQDSLNNENQDQNSKDSFTYKLPLVLLSDFKSLKVNLDLENQGFDQVKIIVDPEVLKLLENSEKEKLQNLLKVNKFDTETIDKFNFQNSSKNKYFLTVLSQVDFTKKILKINGKSIFRDNDYKLFFDLKRNSEFDQEILNFIDFDKTKIKRLFFGGEIITARAVDRLFLNKTDNYTFLFDRIDEEIKSADLAFAMLENPLSGNPQPCTGCTTFVSDKRNIKGYKQVGLDVFSFGNHAGDGGLKAIQDTEMLFKEEGLSFTGVSSKNINEASKLIIKDLDGFEIGFISFDDIAYFYWAGENRWGTNRFSKAVNIVDYDRIKKVISEAKKKVDFLIVYPSWGVEYTNKSTQHQKKLAHALVDNGVDMIVGSHPHWVQEFEVYESPQRYTESGEEFIKVPIFYSLGNFIFDQTHTVPTRQGIWMNAYLYDNKIVNFEIIPHQTCGYHQTSNNLAYQVIKNEMTYKQVDALSEKQGCIWWQPKPLDPDSKEYSEVWDRFIEYTNY